MKILAVLCFLLAAYNNVFSQKVGINQSSPDPSSTLDIHSTNSGLLIPRMDSAQRVAIASPANGLMVYDTDSNSFWFCENLQWIELSGSIGLKSVNGSSTYLPYNMNPKRYTWELDATFPARTSIPIPQNILEDLCADDDGCSVTLTMTNWTGGITETRSRTVTMFYSITVAGRLWSTNYGITPAVTSGIDGDGTVGIISGLYDNIFLSDAIVTTTASANDSAPGLNFYKWVNYAPTTIGRLIIED